MKFVRKKIIDGAPYFYFEYGLKAGGTREPISRFLGKDLPENLIERMGEIFREIAGKAHDAVPADAKKYFAPKSLLPLEEARFWYTSLHHELNQNDMQLFRSLFAVLFLLNSNRSEGSKATQKDMERVLQRKRKPKTPLELEVLNSFITLRYAFSKEMKWNIKTLKSLHAMLLNRLAPEIAGTFKKENNVINNEPTTDWKQVRKELKKLFEWFLKVKKSQYPPIVALEFHHRFEAIHPFADGNGRIGRLLCNAYLIQQGYMPVIFFSENHKAYCAALTQARQGRKRKLAHYLIGQVAKTRKATLEYKKAGIIRGGSAQVGQWEIERGKIRKY